MIRESKVFNCNAHFDDLEISKYIEMENKYMIRFITFQKNSFTEKIEYLKKYSMYGFDLSNKRMEQNTNAAIKHQVIFENQHKTARFTLTEDTNGLQFMDVVNVEIWHKKPYKSKKQGFVNAENMDYYLITNKYDVVGLRFSNGLGLVNIGAKPCKGVKKKNYKYNLYAWDACGGKWGYVDKTGNESIPLIYNAGRDFQEGLAWVQLNNKWGAINTKGAQIAPFDYDYSFDFKNGFAQVRKNGKWGLINRYGKEIIELKYANCHDLVEGLICVKSFETEKYGYVDVSGKEIIPMIYSSASDFNNGKAEVWKDGIKFNIDKTGKTID